ncbi:uncharacterized protein N7498_000018 [Penicillium cinerascens]|uniref:Uncharacterized protein n=1 Tax=Penicillium cinerascens TaxID=70096 RepID=A0A9W9NDP1_9EURO|nr:uncharacterized protein N7498_000018 [Penicillium cinerascens]KAJ5217919.1 hypothetical protein N7498_000018 [Penicillium cinerascens]
MNIAALRDRIAELEIALEGISNNICSFGDEVAKAEGLAPWPHLADHLQKTVQSCLPYARQRGDSQANSSPTRRNEGTSVTSLREDQSGNANQAKFHSTQESPHSPTHLGKYLDYMLDGVVLIERSTFVEYLRIACLCYGYMILDSPSIPLNALERPFRLLFPLLTRDTIATFFYARLHATLNNQRPVDCHEIPFFQIGGAGSHYPEIPMSRNEDADNRQTGKTHLVPGPLSAFSPEVQEELSGDWFDIQDLEGYLRAKDITISMEPLPEAPWAVNAVEFTAAENISFYPEAATPQCAAAEIFSY